MFFSGQVGFFGRGRARPPPFGGCGPAAPRAAPRPGRAGTTPARSGRRGGQGGGRGGAGGGGGGHPLGPSRKNPPPRPTLPPPRAVRPPSQRTPHGMRCACRGSGAGGAGRGRAGGGTVWTGRAKGIEFGGPDHQKLTRPRGAGRSASWRPWLEGGGRARKEKVGVGGRGEKLARVWSAEKKKRARSHDRSQSLSPGSLASPPLSPGESELPESQSAPVEPTVASRLHKGEQALPLFPR